MKQNMMTGLVTVGLLLIAVGMLMPIFNGASIASDTFRYVYAIGAAILFIGRVLSPYKGNNARVRRLSRIETWSSIFFLAAAFFLFYDKNIFRDALAFTLAGGAVQAYTSIMIPLALKKKNLK